MERTPNEKVRLDLPEVMRGNEKGAALVIGLMFLAILAMVGTTAVVLTTTDLQIGGNYIASQQAFNVAQAGINEALYRLGLFSDNTKPPPSGSYLNINNIADNNAAIEPDATNPDWKAIILFSSTVPPGPSGNIIYTNTIQPSGSWPDLEYSSSTDDGTALAIEFLKDDNYDPAKIVYYDAAKTPPYNVATEDAPATGQPVVVITSTGRANGAANEIKMRAVRQPINIKGESAAMVDMGPDLTGSALISGLNHSISTTPSDEKDGPNWHATSAFNSDGIDNHGGKEGASADVDTDLDASEEIDYESEIAYGQKLETSGHKPGVWTTQPADTVAPGNIHVFGGNDSAAWKEEGAPNWPSLAELLGVSQETMDSILANANVTVADMDGSKLALAPQGIIYIDNYGGDTLKITASTPGNEDGWGLMYVTGNARFEKLYFKGLIYVEGDAVIVSNFWLLGCIAIKGDAEGDFSAGNGTFLYSEASLKMYVNKAMKFVPLTWEDSGLSDSSGSWLGF